MGGKTGSRVFRTVQLTVAWVRIRTVVAEMMEGQRNSTVTCR